MPSDERADREDGRRDRWLRSHAAHDPFDPSCRELLGSRVGVGARTSGANSSHPEAIAYHAPVNEVRARYESRPDAVVCVIGGFGRVESFETGLDPATFRDLGSGYARDDARVVYFGDRIEAEAASFVVLAGGFAKDRATVFLNGEAAETPDDGDWDAGSFVAFDASYVADRRGVFCRRYGYDCYEIVPTPGARADDFEALGLAFARAPRAGLVWLRGEPEPRLDAASVAIIGDFFVRDRSAVYHLAYGGKHTDETGLLRIDARPETFRVLGEHYAADERTAFYYLNDPGDADIADLTALPGVAPAELEVLADVDPGLARAGDALFIHGERAEGVSDVRTFRRLGPGYARDDGRVYQLVAEMREVARAGYSLSVVRPELVLGASPDTFELPSPP